MSKLEQLETEKQNLKILIENMKKEFNENTISKDDEFFEEINDLKKKNHLYEEEILKKSVELNE